MARSAKRSLTVPHPVRDALQTQIEDGTLNYPSENAAIIGLIRYQLICGKAHPLTEPIARMHPDEQDVIDDFLLAITEAGLNLKGQFLENLVKQVTAGEDSQSLSVVNQLLPTQLLKMAKQWKAGKLDLEQLRAERGE